MGFALYETIGFVLASEALTVTRITVQGNQRMSRGEVLGLLDGLSGGSIVMTDLESWRRNCWSLRGWPMRPSAGCFPERWPS